MTAAFAVARRLLASNAVSFAVTAAVALCATSSPSSAVALSNGNYVWLLAAMSPFFFVFHAYKKLGYLGMSKRSYFAGSLLAYGLLAALISLVNTLVCLLIDPLIRAQTVVNLMRLCGWMENGPIVAFFQQAAFLFCAMAFLHALLLSQGQALGFLMDGALLVILCVFLPIAPLRGLVAGFFSLVMMNGRAALHIPLCLLLSAGCFAVSLLALKRKTA